MGPDLDIDKYCFIPSVFYLIMVDCLFG